jgi:hypothetical protein
LLLLFDWKVSAANLKERIVNLFRFDQLQKWIGKNSYIDEQVNQ